MFHIMYSIPTKYYFNDGWSENPAVYSIYFKHNWGMFFWPYIGIKRRNPVFLESVNSGG